MTTSEGMTDPPTPSLPTFICEEATFTETSRITSSRSVAIMHLSFFDQDCNLFKFPNETEAIQMLKYFNQAGISVLRALQDNDATIIATARLLTLDEMIQFYDSENKLKRMSDGVFVDVSDDFRTPIRTFLGEVSLRHKNLQYHDGSFEDIMFSVAKRKLIWLDNPHKINDYYDGVYNDLHMMKRVVKKLFGWIPKTECKSVHLEVEDFVDFVDNKVKKDVTTDVLRGYSFQLCNHCILWRSVEKSCFVDWANGRKKWLAKSRSVEVYMASRTLGSGEHKWWEKELTDEIWTGIFKHGNLNPSYYWEDTKFLEYVYYGKFNLGKFGYFCVTSFFDELLSIWPDAFCHLYRDFAPIISDIVERNKENVQCDFFSM